MRNFHFFHYSCCSIGLHKPHKIKQNFSVKVFSFEHKFLGRVMEGKLLVLFKSYVKHKIKFSHTFWDSLSRPFNHRNFPNYSHKFVCVNFSFSSFPTFKTKNVHEILHFATNFDTKKKAVIFPSGG
jgi:hypothetical protein